MFETALGWWFCYFILCKSCIMIVGVQKFHNRRFNVTGKLCNQDYVNIFLFVCFLHLYSFFSPEGNQTILCHYLLLHFVIITMLRGEIGWKCATKILRKLLWQNRDLDVGLPLYHTVFHICLPSSSFLLQNYPIISCSSSSIPYINAHRPICGKCCQVIADL